MGARQHDLIRILHPDLLLMSVARHHLRAITFQPGGSKGIANRRGEEVLRRAAGGSDCRGVEPLVVFGQAAQRPFGAVSTADSALWTLDSQVLNG
jgi:hypothetical protein